MLRGPWAQLRLCIFLAAGQTIAIADVAHAAAPEAAAVADRDAQLPVAANSPPSSAPPLQWVNPARCLNPCAFDPGATLMRVDERGHPQAKGRHRLHPAAVRPLQELLAGAARAGHKIRLSSAYRSYQEQARLFRATKEKGRAARPGHSEHQLGTAIDLRLPDTAALQWLAAHAPDHGFVLSYPAGKQRITGYRPEPWHVRFVGPTVATELRHHPEATLEELFRGHPDLATSGTCADCPAPASRRPCGRATAAGTCAGPVLTWCYEGALNSVDCSAFSQTCGHLPNEPIADCVPSEQLPPAPGP